MDDFPTTMPPPLLPVQAVHRNQSLRSEQENGRTLSRGKFTSGKKRFTLAWQRVTAAQLSILLNFFDSHAGDSFRWTDPGTSTTHTVIFDIDEVQYSNVMGTSYNISNVVLREI